MNFRQWLQIKLKIASYLYNWQRVLLISLLLMKMSSLLMRIPVKKIERKLRKRETRRNQRLIKSQLKILISLLNENVWWRELYHISEIILIILDQEVKSLKDDSVVLMMIFICIESAIICFHLLFMKIESQEQRSKRWWRK